MGKMEDNKFDIITRKLSIKDIKKETTPVNTLKDMKEDTPFNIKIPKIVSSLFPHYHFEFDLDFCNRYNYL